MSNLKILVGDLFKSKAQTLVNTVNCVGVMGKGIALEFKKRFPDMFRDYAERCARREVKIGQPYVYRVGQPWILNFPTKQDWRALSRLEDVEAGLKYLLSHYREWGISSLAVPPLGTGHGQLEWRIVGPILQDYLSRLDIPVELYAPHGTPQSELTIDLFAQTLPQSEHAQAVTAGQFALVEILYRIERTPYHWPVGRTTFQKIAYVASRQKLPAGLQFKRGAYGPFSEGLKPLTARLMRNQLLSESTEGRMIAVHVGDAYGRTRPQYVGELEEWNDKIEKVVDLFVRMRTQEAERAATILYAEEELAARVESKPTERDVLNAVLEWKGRREGDWKEATIATSVRSLAILGWLRVNPSFDLPVPDDLKLETN